MKWKLKQHKLIALSLFAIAIISVTAWSMVQKLESDKRKEIGHYLTTQLDTTHQAVELWFKEHKAAAQVWANTPEVLDLSIKLLATPHTRKLLIASPAQHRLRHWFQPLLTVKGYQGYFIIGPDNINLASSRDQNIGVESLLIRQSQFIQKIWAGETAVSLPVKSDVPLPDGEGKLREGLPTMFVGAPIKDHSGKVVAIFTFRLNPLTDFTSILQQGRFGLTGETYAFDDKGRLISGSRFDSQLRDIGLLSAGETDILNIELRNPGVNLLTGKKSNLPRDRQPLTLMAAQAIGGGRGMDLNGYNDYRGVPVIGSWLWDDDLGFGISTELDLDEAYQTLRATRYTIITLTLLLIFMSLGIAIIIFNNNARRRIQQALEESEKRFKAQYKGIPAPIYTWRKQGDDFVLIDYNEAAHDITGGGIKNHIGQTLHELYSEHPNPEVGDNVRRCFSTQTVIRKEMQYNMQLTGELKHLDMVYVPLSPDLVMIHTYDLTERKLAEKSLRRSEVFELLATGASLNKILTALAVSVEKHDPEILCSILLLDENGKYLRHGSAPTLPDFFNEAIDGVAIGSEVASCGAAAYTGKRFIVEDIMAHPNWVDFRTLADKAGLRACWSEPVISSQGKVLGTFASYYREPRIPQQQELDFIQDSARLAAIAIERKQAEEALRESEQKYKSVVENIGIGVALISPDMEILALNKQMGEWFPDIDVTNRPLCYRSFNNPPRESNCSYCLTKKTLVDGQVYESTTETPAGDKIRHFRIVSSPIKDESGKIVAAIEMVEDITERKQAENALRNIVEGTSPLTGQDFLRTLVKQLADTLGIQHAFVGELTGERIDAIQTVVVWSGADYGENFQYELTDTPCENVIGQELCCYPQGIRERFPDDHLLVEMDADSYIGAPLFDSHGKPIGILAVLHDKPIENELLVKSIVSIFAGRAAAELERQHTEAKKQQLLQQNRDLTQRMFRVQEEERRHLARELHDEFGQWLTGIHINAEIIKQLNEGKDEGIHATAQVIEESATEMHKNIRGMIRQLRPTLLDELGLVESLKELVNQWQAKHPAVGITLSLDGDLDKLGDNLNITIYRIIQESLTNVAKYAGARDVAVELTRQPGKAGEQDSLLLSVEDNGKGMDTSTPTDGMGLPGMRERVLAAGGEFTIYSSPGKGMHIEACIPIN